MMLKFTDLTPNTYTNNDSSIASYIYQAMK